MSLDAFFWSFPVKNVDSGVWAEAELLELGKPKQGSRSGEAGGRRRGWRGAGKRVETYMSGCGYRNETRRLEPQGRGDC